MVMVITNLVENAIKYNRDHGKVRVTINADPYNFYISVEDTGVGIPQDSLDKIYERFYRVDKSRSREVGGTGLGLSITKSIILQHHGAIDVSSIEGEGTKFTVTVPLTYVAHPVELRRQSERIRRSGNRKRQVRSNTAASARKRSSTAQNRTSVSSSASKNHAAGAAKKTSAAGTPKKASSAGTARKASSSGTAKKVSSSGTAKRSPSAEATKKTTSAGTAKKASSAGTVKKKSAGTAAKKTSGTDGRSSGAGTAKRTQSSGT